MINRTLWKFLGYYIAAICFLGAVPSNGGWHVKPMAFVGLVVITTIWSRAAP